MEPRDAQSESPPQAGASRDLRLALGVAVGATALFFLRALLTDQVFIARDLLRVYYPAHHYWAERVRAGEVPTWFPYDGLGQPFVGLLVAGVFHPLKLLYLWLPLGTALKLNLLVCYPLGLVGVYLLARQRGLSRWPALLAGSLATFSGYLLAMTSNLLYVEAAVTMPWALWAGTRYFRRPSPAAALGCAALSALVLFAGDAQAFALTLAGLGLVALTAAPPSGRGWLQRAAHLAALWALSIGLGAIQWLPTLGVRGTSRFAGQSFTSASGWPLHPLRLYEVLLGPLFGLGGAPNGEVARLLLGHEVSQLWAGSVYFGLPWVVLALLGCVWRFRERAVRWAAAAAALVLLLALGARTPLYGLFFRFVPVWSSFRFPEKLTPVLFLLLALGAGLGLEEVLGSERRRARLLQATLLCAALSAAAAVAELGSSGFSAHLLGATAEAGLSTASLEALHAVSLRWTATTALLCLLVTLALVVRGLTAPLLLLVCLGALWTAGEPLSELTFPETLEVMGPLARRIDQLEGGRRLGEQRVGIVPESYWVGPTAEETAFDRLYASFNAGLAPVSGALWNLETINPYLPAARRELWDLDGSIPPALYNVKYEVYDEGEAKRAGLRLSGVVARSDRGLAPVLVRSASYWPRAFVTRPLCLAGPREVLEALKQHAFDLHQEAAIDCGEAAAAFGNVRAPGSALEGFGAGRVAITSYQPERVVLDAVLDQPGALVLNDADYPGWTALVDGAPQPIRRANYLVRALLLPAGPHHVEFRYRDGWLVAGAWVSLGALCLALLLVARSRRSR
jgi:hypothetical protein